MHSQQDLHVLRQLTSEREEQLHHAIPEARHSSQAPMRRRLGFQLVRLGAWIAAERAVRPAPAR